MYESCLDFRKESHGYCGGSFGGYLARAQDTQIASLKLVPGRSMSWQRRHPENPLTGGSWGADPPSLKTSTAQEVEEECCGLGLFVPRKCWVLGPSPLFLFCSPGLDLGSHAQLDKGSVTELHPSLFLYMILLTCPGKAGT